LSWRKSPCTYPTKYLCHTPQVFLTCREILRHGADCFTSPRTEVVLRIFIALTNPSPRPCLNPWNLGPVASTISTRPPGTTNGSKLWCILFHPFVKLALVTVWNSVTIGKHVSNTDICIQPPTYGPRASGSSHCHSAWLYI
jgi:hypothetical protein